MTTTTNTTKENPVPEEGSTWIPSHEAISAALRASGTPPNLDIRGMLQAAWRVDGAAILTSYLVQLVEALGSEEVSAVARALAEELAQEPAQELPEGAQ